MEKEKKWKILESEKESWLAGRTMEAVKNCCNRTGEKSAVVIERFEKEMGGKDERTADAVRS